MTKSKQTLFHYPLNYLSFDVALQKTICTFAALIGIFKKQIIKLMILL